MNSEKFAILMLFIITTYCSNSTAACFNVNSEKICQGKKVSEDQKNPVYTYYRLISAQKVILGEYHWLTQHKKNKYIFNEFISGRGAGDGTLNEYILTGNKIKLKRTIRFSPSGEYVDNFDLINAVEKKYSGNSMKVRKFRKMPFNYLKKCWGGNEPCSLPMHYATK